ncbi:hypothetical protein BGW41_003566 [Actinomortierella wolfii]|nr:hypothetical protein BGW41_003566 [Actinomortierella wolfii]
MVSLDLVDSSGSVPANIRLPADDAQYQSPNTPVLNGTVPFNQTVPTTGPGGQRTRVGVNMVTSFLDASFLYGSNSETVRRLREPQGCRMRVSKGKDGKDYPPLQEQNSSRYDFGASTTRAQDALVSLFITIFIREHNNYCEKLKKLDTSLSDDDAFEQSRAYIIALFQHITYTEYLGMILGQTLQPAGPDSYKPEVTPGIDVFFATASFRYGHSELSDYYQIMDNNDQYLTTLSMRDLRDARLIETYGMETFARLCARQIQEEVDIYYSDETRNAVNSAGRPFDLAQLDILRGRDHGIPFYNEARKLFGLPPKTSFAEMSSDPAIQKKLQDLYGSVDRIETIVGALLEQHGEASNLGDLFWRSIYQQFWNIRASDRFWYTRPGVLSPGVLAEVRRTTLRSLMMRHFDDGSVLPDNIWKHTPKSDGNRGMGKFLIEFTPTYKISWVTKSDSITFTMSVLGEVGWVGFGIGPNPHMAGAVFYIVDNRDGQLKLQKYVSQGIATIPRPVKEIQSFPIPPKGQPMTVTWDHPLVDNDIEISPSKNLYALYAQSSTKQLTYHGSGDSRGYYAVNFFTSAVSAGLSNSPINTHKYHGIGMFICWGVAFPLSAFIVRYHKHSLANAITIHRYIQVLTGVSITSLATAAISTSTPGRGQTHKYVGVTILALVVGQLGLGLVVIYSLERIEYASRGVAMIVKWMHRVLGSSLFILAWYNIYLGMVAYPSPRRWIIAYFVYLAVMIISVCIYHVYWHKTGRVKKGSMAIRVGDYLTPGNKHSLKKLPSSWPKMTWNEINDRVLSGAKLVVVDDYVFDIRSWINSHPGGAKVLQRVIGTDITADLYGHYNDSPSTHQTNEKGGLLEEGELEMSPMNLHRHSPSFNTNGSGSSQTGLLASQEFTTNLPKELEYLEHLPPPPSPAGAGAAANSNRLTAMYRRLSLYVDEDKHINPEEPLKETPTLTERLTEKVRRLQRAIDRLNTNSTSTMRASSHQPLRRPLTMHTHSIRAVARLATYCIAQLDRSLQADDIGVSSARRTSTQLPGELTSTTTTLSSGLLSAPLPSPSQAMMTQRKRMSVAVLPVPVIQSNRVFRRYIMTSKATVSNEHAQRPVRRFTFRSVQPRGHDQTELHKSFVPGDYVEIQCVAQGQVITRAYTPVEGNMEEFTLLVRVYPFGLVSRFLDKKVPGYEVRVRGPFDQAIRQRARNDYLSGGAAGYDSGGDTSNYEDDDVGKRTIQRVLLNPADPERGCWSMLLMIAGGTGLTPMLQLIHHHLRHASHLDRHFCMYMLYLNQTPKDIIAGPYLDSLVQQSNGILHITYAIKEGVPKTIDIPGANRRAGVYVGELNIGMLQRWLLTVAKMQRQRCGLVLNNDSSKTSESGLSSPTSPSRFDLSSLSQPTSPSFPSQNWASSSRPSPSPPPIPPRIQRHQQQQQQQQPEVEELQYLVVDHPQDNNSQSHDNNRQSQPPRSHRTVSYADLPSPGLPRSSEEQITPASREDALAQGRVEYWKVLSRPASRLVVSGPPRMMECTSDALNELRFPSKNRVFMT